MTDHEGSQWKGQNSHAEVWPKSIVYVYTVCEHSKLPMRGRETVAER